MRGPLTFRTRCLIAAIAVLAGAGVLAAMPTAPVALVALFLLGAPVVVVALAWRTVDRLARVVVAVAISLTLNGLVAEVMLAAGVWSPSAGIAVVGVAVAALAITLGHLPARELPAREEGTAR
jgi:hypothetical protein